MRVATLASFYSIYGLKFSLNRIALKHLITGNRFQRKLAKVCVPRPNTSIKQGDVTWDLEEHSNGQ
jgi:hypothetical protein